MCLAVLCFGASAQDLKLETLISLAKSDIGVVNDVMNSRGWRFIGRYNNKSKSMYDLSWAYNPNVLDTSKVADSWLNIHVSAGKIIGVEYQFSDAYVYRKICTSIATISIFKLPSSIDENTGAIQTLYIGKTYTYDAINNPYNNIYGLYDIIVEPKYLMMANNK